ncbi:MAG: tetratricopeptide repeat protein [Bacteroidales bacterium]|nr:tetratricopeptide repeat protein [Bacteroidales bacterium]
MLIKKGNASVLSLRYSVNLWTVIIWNSTMRKICLIFLITYSLVNCIKAQQTLSHIKVDRDFERGIELLEKEKYSTAQKLFESAYERNKNNLSYIAEQANYYIAYCAVKLFNEDTEFLTFRFIGENPESPLVNDAYFNLAGYFYSLNKWKDAIKYYEHTNPDRLDREQMAEHHFKLGYAYFMTEDYSDARLAFYKIKDIDTKYTPPALYYYSHIHYEEENYQTALNGYLRLLKDKTFGPIAPYYIVQIYYKQGRYKELIDFAPGVIEKVTSKRLAEVSHITAEAHSELGLYEESLPFYQTFLDSAKTVTKEDKYQAGYSFYKAEQYDRAVDLFSSVSGAQSQLGQNASYYLADCYLKSNEKQKARLAFQSASGMDYDPVIKQDALFNYALITYELGSDPFNEAIWAFEEFIKQYPESKRINEAYHYLIQAYLSAHNYRKALESLDKSALNTPELKTAYQKIAYYRGVELFNNRAYKEASIHFDKSLKFGNNDNLLKAKAHYWKAESQFRINNFNEAVTEYNAFKNTTASYTLEEFEIADYNIGYCRFKQKNYASAIENFRKFVTNADQELKNYTGDALIRIGDCYFVQAEYYPSVDFYSRAIEKGGPNTDYALLQKGICLGLINKDSEKVNTLSQLVAQYPNSKFADDGIYEMAQSYIKLQQIDKAVAQLKRLIAENPESPYAPNSYVQLGLLYYNRDNNTEAIKYYKEAVKRFQGTQASKDALFGLKNIYVDLDRVDDYFAFVNSLEGSSIFVSADEQDSLSYISAEKQYMAGNCEASAKAFKKYITNYPNGSFLLNAHFFKADCDYQNGDFEEALSSFKYVIDQPGSVYRMQALLGCARIESQKKNYNKASGYYREILQNNPGIEIKKEALIAMMESQFQEKKYSDALSSAKEVLTLDKLDEFTERKARYIAARSLQEEGRDALAIDEYKLIAGEVVSTEGAESKFRIAELYFNRGDYSNAEKQIIEFSERSSPHEYWIARSFILWADIFAERGEYFQATQTLQSLIDYYENSTDGILEMAKVKKAAITEIQERKEKPAENPELEINID